MCALCTQISKYIRVSVYVCVFQVFVLGVYMLGA